MIEAAVEIDYARGVVYIHDKRTGATILRVCNLPAPIPLNVSFIDVTNKVGSSYTAEASLPEPTEECNGANDGSCSKHPNIPQDLVRTLTTARSHSCRRKTETALKTP